MPRVCVHVCVCVCVPVCTCVCVIACCFYVHTYIFFTDAVKSGSEFACGIFFKKIEKSFCHNGASKRQLEQGPDPGKHGAWLPPVVRNVFWTCILSPVFVAGLSQIIWFWTCWI